MAEPVVDLQECVARVKLGDEEAARTLMQVLYPVVIRIVRSHKPRRESEEDLAQAVFVKIFTKLDQYAGTVPLEHWVSRVAVNTCLNQIQREQSRPEWRWADLSEEEADVIQNLAVGDDGMSMPHDVAARDLVDQLLATLKPEDRLIMTLLYIEGCSVEEVRDQTGWNVPLIKIRSFRARQKLKKQLTLLLKEAKL